MMISAPSPTGRSATASWPRSRSGPGGRGPASMSASKMALSSCTAPSPTIASVRRCASSPKTSPGVKEVRDCLVWVEPLSGFVVPPDESATLRPGQMSRLLGRPTAAGAFCRHGGTIIEFLDRVSIDHDLDPILAITFHGWRPAHPQPEVDLGAGLFKRVRARGAGRGCSLPISRGELPDRVIPAQAVARPRGNAWPSRRLSRSAPTIRFPRRGGLVRDRGSRPARRCR